MSDKVVPSKTASGANDGDLLARLQAAEAKIAEDKALIDRLQHESDAVKDGGGRRYSPKDQPFVGSAGGYSFEVTPMIKEDNHDLKHLKPRRVTCCDESEAKRWYCQANEMKLGSGIPVDPVKVRLEVKCLDDKRAKSLMRQKQVSVLRQKVQAGQVLSEADQALLAQCEHEIYGYEETL